jgi:Delta7-sterol 5-desaturase
VDSLFYFLDQNFWTKPWLIVLFTVSIFVILLIRYFGTAVFYQLLLKKVFRLNLPSRKNSRYRKEIMWSAISSIIFTALAIATFYLFQKGYTKIYIDWSDRSFTYFLFSIVLLLVLYETYYYWLHRWMHRPSVFKVVHKVHHQSIHPTVFTSFSFHPLEAILQFIFIPVAIMIIPIHYYGLAIVLTIMTLSAVINHAGVEIFPKNFISHPLGKWLIGSTHHDLHHKEFRSNYGLYLTFWDKWMKTENENFAKEFQSNQEKTIRSQSQHHPSADGLRK